MTDQGWMTNARRLVEDALTEQEGWADIVVNLRSEGLEDKMIKAVLREHQAWVQEAQEWKYHGYPYDEIVRYLRDEVAAEWSDVAHALLYAGLAPADMLRVLLPFLGEDSPLPVVRTGLLEPPGCIEEAEAWNVVDYYYPGMSDLAGVIDEPPN